MTTLPPQRWYEAISLQNGRLFAIAVVLAVVPLWFGRYLPLVDMPQHAGQIAALQQMFAGNETFANAFQINWFTPYLLGYLLLYVLSLILPVTVAAQVLVSLSVASVPVLTGRLLRAAGADERWKWLAIPCGFSFAFYWGFLSFIVAVPFALLFLVMTIRFAQAADVRKGIGIAVFAIFLFFCHVIVLGFASLVALGYVVGSSYRFGIKSLVLRMLPYTAPLPLIALWLIATYSNEAIVRSDPIVFAPMLDHLLGILIQPSGLDDLDLFRNALITGPLVMLPYLCGARCSQLPERYLPFALGLLVFLVAPHYVLSTAYFYQRLGIFLVPLWLLMWDPPKVREGRLEGVAMLVVVVWALMNAGRFAAFARETESFEEILAKAQPGKKVAAMVFDRSSPQFATPVYLHFPVWYQSGRLGIVDFNFADFHSQMARYPKTAGPRITDYLSWNPTQFDWDANGGDSYDYFIVKAKLDVSDAIFKEKRGAVELVVRSGWWWLYRNVSRVQGRQSTDTFGDNQQGAAYRQ